MSNLFLLFIVGFFASVIIAPFVIKTIKKLKYGQNILQYVDHQQKQGTPTMGGIIFLFGLIVCFLLIAFKSDNRLSLLLLISTLGFGLLGFLDDFLKIKFKHNEGLKPYQKAFGQVGIAVIMAVFIYTSELVGSEIIIPFTSIQIDLGWGIIPFAIFVYLAITNGVNLTDGLDGLAGGVSVTYLISFVGIIGLYIVNLSTKFNSIMLNETYNLLLLSCGFIGCVVAFLCFNSHPAKIFMGDAGSLALGGFIAGLACLTKLYLFVPIIGVMFVINTISVIIQVMYYKKTKKRIFKMAPLHHHYEKNGVFETKIVSVYIIITLVVGVISLYLTTIFI